MPESKIDWQMIGELEGNELEGYVPSRGGVPLGSSGVTIGMGCDLGAINEAALDALDIPPALKDKLRPYLGLKGTDAQNALKTDPVHLGPDEVVQLNAAVKASQIEALRRAYDNAVGSSGAAFDDLPEEAQTVIASVKFQWGNIWSPNHRSAAAREFWSAATARDWTRMQAVLRGWTPQTYKTRRNKEADYLASIATPKDGQSPAADGASMIGSA